MANKEAESLSYGVPARSELDEGGKVIRLQPGCLLGISHSHTHPPHLCPRLFLTRMMGLAPVSVPDPVTVPPGCHAAGAPAWVILVGSWIRL